jgi:hypothetical protein
VHSTAYLCERKLGAICGMMLKIPTFMRMQRGWCWWADLCNRDGDAACTMWCSSSSACGGQEAKL